MKLYSMIQIANSSYANDRYFVLICITFNSFFLLYLLRVNSCHSIFQTISRNFNSGVGATWTFIHDYFFRAHCGKPISSHILVHIQWRTCMETNVQKLFVVMANKSRALYDQVFAYLKQLNANPRLVMSLLWL